MNNWNGKHLDNLARDGKIRGYRINKHPVKKPAAEKQHNKIPPGSKPSTEKSYIGWNLLYFCNEHAIDLSNLKTEYQFLPDRKFRFDWAITSLKIAVEFEGIISDKSRHTTVKGYSTDADKYNLAAADGWIVLRFTVINYKSLNQKLKDAFTNVSKR